MPAIPDGIRQHQPHSESLSTLGGPALRRSGSLGGLRPEGQKARGERGMTKLKSNESCRCWRRLRGVYQLEKEVGPVGADRQVADLAHDKHGRLPEGGQALPELPQPLRFHKREHQVRQVP